MKKSHLQSRNQVLREGGMISCALKSTGNICLQSIHTTAPSSRNLALLVSINKSKKVISQHVCFRIDQTKDAERLVPIEYKRPLSSPVDVRRVAALPALPITTIHGSSLKDSAVWSDQRVLSDCTSECRFLCSIRRYPKFVLPAACISNRTTKNCFDFDDLDGNYSSELFCSVKCWSGCSRHSTSRMRSNCHVTS